MAQSRDQFWQVFNTPWGPVTAVGADKLVAVLLREPSDQEKGALGQEVTKAQQLDGNGEPITFGGFEAWLDAYIQGENPSSASVEVEWPEDATPFCLWVWQSLADVTQGTTITYGELARKWEQERGGRMAAQAVGGALRRNPLPLVYPCHRVLGSNGAITGYAGGTTFKHDLLAHENVLDHVRPSER